MTIIRAEHNKNNPYTMVNITTILDKRLSWKAKGIWLYAFSRPDDWSFYTNDIIKQSIDGRESVRSGLKELEKYGYLKVIQPKEENGNFGKANWTLYENPLPQCDKPACDFTIPVNDPLLSIDSNLVLKENNIYEGESECGLCVSDSHGGSAVACTPKPQCNFIPLCVDEEEKAQDREVEAVIPQPPTGLLEPSLIATEEGIFHTITSQDMLKFSHLKPHERVQLTEVEVTKILCDYNSETLVAAVNNLLEWKIENPKKAKKRRSDYRCLLKWGLESARSSILLKRSNDAKEQRLKDWYGKDNEDCTNRKLYAKLKADGQWRGDDDPPSPSDQEPISVSERYNVDSTEDLVDDLFK